MAVCVRQFWAPLGLLVSLMLHAATAYAGDLYVDNLAGDDRRNGESLVSNGASSGPVRTISKAMRLARQGDSIYLAAHADHPYQESITLQGGSNSGTATTPFRIIGNGAVIDGLVTLDDAPWEYAGGSRFRYSPRLKGTQILLLEGKLAKQIPAKQNSLPKLQPGEWTWFEGAFVVQTSPSLLPQGMRPACAGLSVGLSLVDVHDVEISDLTLRGFQLDGVNAHDNIRRTNLTNLTCEFNGRSGITIAGASRVLVDSCICRDNGLAQFRTEGRCQVQLVDNQFDPSSAPAMVNEGGQVVDENQPQ